MGGGCWAVGRVVGGLEKSLLFKSRGDNREDVKSMRGSMEEMSFEHVVHAGATCQASPTNSHLFSFLHHRHPSVRSVFLSPMNH